MHECMLLVNEPKAVQATPTCPWVLPWQCLQGSLPTFSVCDSSLVVRAHSACRRTRKVPRSSPWPVTGTLVSNAQLPHSWVGWFWASHGTLAPREVRRDEIAICVIGNLLCNIRFLCFSWPSLACSTSSLCYSVFPGTTSQINNLHLKPFVWICFATWWNHTKETADFPKSFLRTKSIWSFFFFF